MKERSHAEVAGDHYLHILAVGLAALYGWQVHTFWIGIGIWLLLYLGISVSNMVLMTLISEDTSTPFRWLRFNRWAWVACAFLAIGISGASLGTT